MKVIIGYILLGVIVLFILIMLRIKRHYDSVGEAIRFPDRKEINELLANDMRSKAILPVQALNRSFLKTLNFARSCGFGEVELYHVCDAEEKGEALKEQIEALGLDARFVYEVTPYRNMNEVLLRHVQQEAEKLPEHEVLTVMMGSLVCTNILQKPLHNDTTQRLARKMERYENVAVFTVPYII